MWGLCCNQGREAAVFLVINYTITWFWNQKFSFSIFKLNCSFQNTNYILVSDGDIQDWRYNNWVLYLLLCRWIKFLVINISIGRINIFFVDHISIEKYIYISFVTSNRIFLRMWIETETTKFLFILYMNVEYVEWWSSYLLPFCPWPSNACLLLSYDRKI